MGDDKRPPSETATADELKALIRNRYTNKTYKIPRYIIAEEVNSSVGWRGKRWLDMIVFDCWPSGGMKLMGFEVKTSRSDLRNELKNPQKSLPFLQILDEFSIVARKGIGGPKMLPDKWGYMVPQKNGRRLHTLRGPLPLHEDQPELSRSFIASFCRAFSIRSESASVLSAAKQSGRLVAKQEMESQVERTIAKYDDLKRSIDQFEEKSGLYIDNWRAGEIGEAVAAIRSSKLLNQYQLKHLRNMAERLTNLANELEAFNAKARENADEIQRGH